jgi:hypothetical protein
MTTARTREREEDSEHGYVLVGNCNAVLALPRTALVQYHAGYRLAAAVAAAVAVVVLGVLALVS